MTADRPPIALDDLLAQRDWVRLLARRLVADENAADDVEQETWAAAIAHPPRHDGATSAWLAAIVRNFARRRFRGAARRAVRERAVARPEANEPSPADLVSKAESHRGVVDAVLRLPEPYRTTVLARYFEGLSTGAIARRTGVPVETVRTRLKRAHAQLRTSLAAEHRDERTTWTAALVPLAWETGGLAMKTSTKAAAAAAVVLVVGGAVVLCLPREPVAPAVGGAVQAAAETQGPRPAPARKAAAPRPDAAAVFGEAWFRDPPAPAAGVEVRLTDGSATRSRAVADARGRFRFEGLDGGSRGAVRVDSGGRTAFAPLAPLAPYEERSVGILWIDATAEVDVVVTAFDGAVIAGARVDAHALDPREWADGWETSETWRDAPDAAVSATTDAAGRARLSGLTPGKHVFVAARSGFATGTRARTLHGGRADEPVRITLEAGFALTGRIVDAEKRPIPGLVVRANPDPDLVVGRSPSVARAATDAAGQFAFEGLRAGVTHLFVAPPAQSPVHVAGYRIPAGAPVEIVLPTATLRGAVRDVGGGPIAGAHVRSQASVGGFAWTDAVTAEDGSYTTTYFGRRVIVHEVRVEKPGYVLVGPPLRKNVGLFDFTAGETVRCDATMRRAAGLHGTVTCDGVPVRGAGATAIRADEGGYPVYLKTVTDGDGRYEIDGIAGSTVLLRVEGAGCKQPDYPDDWSSHLVPGKKHPKWSVDVPAEGGATFDVALVPGASFDGRVVDRADAPVAGADVVCGSASTTSAADGAFHLRGVVRPQGQFTEINTTVWAEKEGFLRSWANPDPIEPLIVRLKPCPVLRGVVRATSGDLRDGYVQWAQRRDGGPPGSDPTPDWSRAVKLPLDHDGRFETPVSVERGAIHVRGGGRDHGPSTPILVQVESGRAAADTTIDVAPSRTLRGRVVDGSGAGIVGASLEIDPDVRRRVSLGGRPVFEAIAGSTDADGRFALPDVPSGPHRLQVDVAGFSPAVVEVDAATADVLVRLERSCEVAGVVVFPDGRPVAMACVTLRRDGATDGDKAPEYVAFADMAGRFRIAVVPPGTYSATITPGRQDDRFLRRTTPGVVAGATDLRFVADAGLSISGRVVGEDGVAISHAPVHFFLAARKYVGSTESKDDGTFGFAGLEPGKFVVVALGPRPTSAGNWGRCIDKRWLRGMVRDVEAGSTGVEVRLPVGATIDGTVVDAAGRPVASLEVGADPEAKPVDDGFFGDGDRPGAITDDAGKFKITGLSPGRYRLAELALGRRAPLKGGESVEAGVTDLRLSRLGTSTIAGRVVDESGAPFAGMNVFARPVGGGDAVAGYTRDDGNFEISGVPDGPRYEVSAQINERTPTRKLDVATGSRDVHLVVTRGIAASGRLLDENDKPVANGTIVLRIENDRIEAQTRTDADGRFTIDHLLPGTYRVECFMQRGGSLVYVPCGTLRAGDSGVDLHRQK